MAVGDQRARVLYRLPEQRRFGASGTPRLLTLVLGVNPINMSAIERNPINLMRALLECLPGGVVIVQALEANGILQRVAAWVDHRGLPRGLATYEVARLS